ncbi:hypothetical protein FVEN_g8584 [Fusarium venenatum]|uniref:AP-1 complex subunit sigma-1 n=1 Tax=Fusarium venenatum TaxID=56646 RepID=A0A2L2TA91_9HYPO|nr:uncharacterized protein FVRRES_03450 [Fusarium venenatum]KAG8353607.1 hypothetical protein FVEN_g8584 [Fusarium venenatum]CEI66938.1 unnamed protein product [Fusarium venenatum]
MAIHYLILLSRQGKVRLAKWFSTLSPKDKAKIVKDVSQLVLARRTRMCNFLEYKDTKIVYRRYASLFFIAGCSSDDNELITLEIIHRYVEQMDKYYGNVCELDIIFSFTKAYYILDEILLAGELQETSKKNILRCIGQQDSLEDMEIFDGGKPPSFISRDEASGWWWLRQLAAIGADALRPFASSIDGTLEGYRVLSVKQKNCYDGHRQMLYAIENARS